jgi:DNA-binding response OmpR family regulator
MRLLLVEDDAMLGEAVNIGLAQDGFVVEWVRDAPKAAAALAAGGFDLCLLDLGLPRGSGLEVLRALRSRGSRLPVIIVTARDAIQDRVAGLDAGADDYVLKPFDLAELAARVRAVARRNGGQASSILQLGEVKLDLAARRAWLNGAPVELSAREFAILESLALAQGRVQTRSELEEKLYGWNGEVESNALEVHIHHLRRKLGSQLIRTVRGVGYAIGEMNAAA